MKTLYNIRQDHMVLLNEVEANEGEVSPEIHNALSITLDEFENKAVSYGYVIKSFDDTIELVNKEIVRLQELKNRAVARQGLIKQTISTAMQEFGVEKLKTPTLSLSFRKSEAVVIEDESLLPARYMDSKVVETVSNTRIKQDIKSGIEIPGAKLITNQNLQIK